MYSNKINIVAKAHSLLSSKGAAIQFTGVSDSPEKSTRQEEPAATSPTEQLQGSAPRSVTLLLSNVLMVLPG